MINMSNIDSINNITNLKRICYLDMVDDKPVLCEQKDVILNGAKFVKLDETFCDRISIIQLYKNKYSKEEIKEQQPTIFLKLNEIIDQTKEILCILTEGKVTVNMTNDEVSHIVDYEMMLEEFNIDTFFDNVAINLSAFYNSSDFHKYDLSCNYTDKKVMAQILLYTRFVESEMIMSYDKEVNIRFCEVYETFCNYLYNFTLLLKIEKKLKAFFSYLLLDEEIDDNSIDFFFFQFEFLVLFDIFHFNSISHFKRLKHRYNNYDEIRKMYASYCKDYSVQSFNAFFPNTSLFSREPFMSVKDCILFALENDFNNKLSNKVVPFRTFARSLYELVNDSFFICKQENIYAFFYDDCLIDFNYILGMLDSLRYTYFMKPRFLYTFINKYDK